MYVKPKTVDKRFVLCYNKIYLYILKGGKKMTDSKTLAYINMFAILGSLPKLCEYDKRAARLVSMEEAISVAF